jgi:hypothetical protein
MDFARFNGSPFGETNQRCRSTFAGLRETHWCACECGIRGGSAGSRSLCSASPLHHVGRPIRTSFPPTSVQHLADTGQPMMVAVLRVACAAAKCKACSRFVNRFKTCCFPWPFTPGRHGSRGKE